jgi:hypothetical protein
MFLVFRRPESPYLSARLQLGGVLPSANYELHFEDTGIKLSEAKSRKSGQTFTGEALRAGIDVTIADAPGALLVTYRQIG